jgi:ABC-2 type transport system ATP-binding protein
LIAPEPMSAANPAPAQAGAAPALAIRDLHFRYRPDAAWAVRAIDLRIMPGEVLGLLGPNGAGTSTLLRLASGLLAPARGDIARPAAPQFALVPQDNAFYPRLTCRENLAFFAAIAGVARARVAERVESCLRTTALEVLAERRADECSGGARRRLNLAIGLLADPALLLLDEPTASVDPQARAFLLDTVRALRARGKAIVYASHYMEEVEAVCDRIAVIDEGRLIASGTLAQILGDGRRLHVRVARDTEPPTGWRVEGPGHWSLEVPSGETVCAHLARLETAGVAVCSVQFGARNLEDVFLALTRRSLRD